MVPFNMTTKNNRPNTVCFVRMRTCLVCIELTWGVRTQTRQRQTTQNTQDMTTGGCAKMCAGYLTLSVANTAYCRVIDELLICTYLERRSQDRAVGIAPGYGLDDRGVGVRVPVGSRIFCSPRRSDRLWSPPNLLSDGYRKIFSRE
jgi:hypothetical protein